MLSVHLICVGKLKEKFYQEACAEYVKRLGAYCKLTVTELPEEKLPADPSQAQIRQALAREAQAIRGKLPSGASLTALCVEGRERSSEDFARLLGFGPFSFSHDIQGIINTLDRDTGRLMWCFIPRSARGSGGDW